MATDTPHLYKLYRYESQPHVGTSSKVFQHLRQHQINPHTYLKIVKSLVQHHGISPRDAIILLSNLVATVDTSYLDVIKKLHGQQKIAEDGLRTLNKAKPPPDADSLAGAKMAIANAKLALKEKARAALAEAQTQLNTFLVTQTTLDYPPVPPLPEARQPVQQQPPSPLKVYANKNGLFKLGIVRSGLYQPLVIDEREMDELIGAAGLAVTTGSPVKCIVNDWIATPRIAEKLKKARTVADLPNGAPAIPMDTTVQTWPPQLLVRRERRIMHLIRTRLDQWRTQRQLVVRSHWMGGRRTLGRYVVDQMASIYDNDILLPVYHHVAKLCKSQVHPWYPVTQEELSELLLIVFNLWHDGNDVTLANAVAHILLQHRGGLDSALSLLQRWLRTRGYTSKAVTTPEEVAKTYPQFRPLCMIVDALSPVAPAKSTVPHDGDFTREIDALANHLADIALEHKQQETNAQAADPTFEQRIADLIVYEAAAHSGFFGAGAAADAKWPPFVNEIAADLLYRQYDNANQVHAWENDSTVQAQVGLVKTLAEWAEEWFPQKTNPYFSRDVTQEYLLHHRNQATLRLPQLKVRLTLNGKPVAMSLDGFKQYEQRSSPASAAKPQSGDKEPWTDLLKFRTMAAVAELVSSMDFKPVAGRSADTTKYLEERVLLYFGSNDHPPGPSTGRADDLALTEALSRMEQLSLGGGTAGASRTETQAQFLIHPSVDFILLRTPLYRYCVTLTTEDGRTLQPVVSLGTDDGKQSMMQQQDGQGRTVFETAESNLLLAVDCGKGTDGVVQCTVEALLDGHVTATGRMPPVTVQHRHRCLRSGGMYTGNPRAILLMEGTQTKEETVIDPVTGQPQKIRKQVPSGKVTTQNHPAKKENLVQWTYDATAHRDTTLCESLSRAMANCMNLDDLLTIVFTLQQRRSWPFQALWYNATHINKDAVMYLVTRLTSSYKQIIQYKQIDAQTNKEINKREFRVHQRVLLGLFLLKQWNAFHDRMQQEHRKTYGTTTVTQNTYHDARIAALYQLDSLEKRIAYAKSSLPYAAVLNFAMNVLETELSQLKRAPWVPDAYPEDTQARLMYARQVAEELMGRLESLIGELCEEHSFTEYREDTTTDRVFPLESFALASWNELDSHGYLVPKDIKLFHIARNHIKQSEEVLRPCTAVPEMSVLFIPYETFSNAESRLLSLEERCRTSLPILFRGVQSDTQSMPYMVQLTQRDGTEFDSDTEPNLLETGLRLLLGDRRVGKEQEQAQLQQQILKAWDQVSKALAAGNLASAQSLFKQMTADCRSYNEQMYC